MDDLSLTDRTGLPDALRVLLEDYPRAGWEDHANFGMLTRFWLDRHLMFRHALALLSRDAEAVVDRRSEPLAYAAALSQLGGRFVAELHGHHQIEDAHYFPILEQKAPEIARGFHLMEADHQQLDPALQDFADTANAALGRIAEGGNAKDATAPFATSLQGLGRLLDRHLTDEEELVVPVVLKLGPEMIG